MKKILAVLFIGLSGSFPLAALAENQATAPNDGMTALSNEALKFKLLSGLLDLSAGPLSKYKHCDFHTSDESKTLTIFRWVAWNLSFFEAGKANSILASCKPRGPSASVCSVEFRADSQGEDPWACGFRFEFNPKTSKVDPSSIECTGSC